MENSVKKPKPNPENENEKNIYKLMQDLSLEPNPSASKQLFTHKAYILKRVETNYVKKKQAEINEKFNSEKRFEKFQKIRMISTKPEDSSMEKMKKTPELQKIAYILEKYKKLEEEELKIKENESEKKNEKKSMIFYDLNYEKNNNSILFNDLPTNFKFFNKK